MWTWGRLGGLGQLLAIFVVFGFNDVKKVWSLNTMIESRDIPR